MPRTLRSVGGSLNNAAKHHPNFGPAKTRLRVSKRVGGLCRTPYKHSLARRASALDHDGQAGLTSLRLSPPTPEAEKGRTRRIKATTQSDHATRQVEGRNVACAVVTGPRAAQTSVFRPRARERMRAACACIGYCRTHRRKTGSRLRTRVLEELARDCVGNTSQRVRRSEHTEPQTAGSEARACEGCSHGKWRLTYTHAHCESVREGRASFTLGLATRTRGEGRRVSFSPCFPGGLRPRPPGVWGPGPQYPWGAR